MKDFQFRKKKINDREKVLYIYDKLINITELIIEFI